MTAAYLKGPDTGSSAGSGNFSCQGKVGFISASIAMRAAKRRKGRVSYRCDFCGLWHVGTNPGKALAGQNLKGARDLIKREKVENVPQP